MLNKIKKYLSSRFYHCLVWVYLIFISVVIIFSVDIFSPFHSFTNISDSMNPVIDRGSLTIVKRSTSYKVGEAIAYHALLDGREEIVTHRIMDIGGNVYTTKGDANAVADRELVKPRLIIGKVTYIIPYLGYLITFTKSLLGNLLLIILPAALIIGSELTRIILTLEGIDREKNI